MNGEQKRDANKAPGKIHGMRISYRYQDRDIIDPPEGRTG